MIVVKILVSFILSIILGLVTIPVILKLCKEHKLYDIPDFRKRHKQAIPRLGGISFLPCMLLSFGLVLLIFSVKYTSEESVHLWYLYLLFAILLIYLIGVLDDVIGLSARLKFLVQFVAACCLPLAGIYINNLYGFFGIHEITAFLGIPLTIIVILLIVNSINLIDGIDGLSSFISILALSGFILLYSEITAWVICVMISGLLGALFAFLRFNLFGDAEKGTKIFMGDSGSLTLGFIISALFVKYLMLSSENELIGTENVVMAYSFLIVPTFDVFRVVGVRIKQGKPIFGADRNHIHHRLMDAGLNQYKALVCIVAMAISYIIVNALLYRLTGDTTLIVVVDVALYTLLSLAISKRRKNKVS